jgi:hypothetical protein
MNYTITSTTKESDDNNNKRQIDNIVVLSGQAYLNFVNAIKSPTTRKLCDIALKRYMRFINAKNIEDLLLSSYLNQEQIRLVDAKIIDFIVHWHVSCSRITNWRIRATRAATPTRTILYDYEIQKS